MPAAHPSSSLRSAPLPFAICTTVMETSNVSRGMGDPLLTTMASAELTGKKHANRKLLIEMLISSILDQLLVLKPLHGDDLGLSPRGSSLRPSVCHALAETSSCARAPRQAQVSHVALDSDSGTSAWSGNVLKAVVPAMTFEHRCRPLRLEKHVL